MIQRIAIGIVCSLLGLLSLMAQQVRVGSERMELLLPLLRGKQVALMVNQSSLVDGVPLLDTLRSSGIDVVKVFVPEHGFRGNVDAGKAVRNGRDIRTGIPIISLYGKVKRPTAEMLRGVDILLFDLQDVGTRFYTYISSMHYLMEAAAEHNKHMIVADRPNPNDYIDGPLLEADCRSFVGMHPIPIAHGLTVGELAQIINGEGWLRGGQRCQLTVVPMTGWKHGQAYTLSIPPSPNLADRRAIELYPSLCLFEATIMSVGRGTDTPFRLLGYPNKCFGKYSFVPKPKPGADSKPRYEGQTCYGVNLTDEPLPKRQISLKWLIYYQRLAQQAGLKFVDRSRMFELLAGTKRLALQLREGMTEAEIRATWSDDLTHYRALRTRYLLYPDYE